MKTLFKKIIIALLLSRAQKVLASKPKVIAITGSMGKTTCKKAVQHVVSQKYVTLSSAEGFNTEIGTLLTLLGEKESGFTSPFKWGHIIWRCFTKKLPAPRVIVLEFGVDAPGDMKALLKIVTPDIAVITNVAPVHLSEDQFTTIDDIADEKMKLLQNISSSSVAIYNSDNPFIAQRTKLIHAKKISYGSDIASAYYVHEMHTSQKGISFEVTNKQNSQNYTIPLFGTYHWTALVPAIIIGRLLGISLSESVQSLQNFSPPSGRGRILEGKKGSILWDHSYNSAPEATTAALKELRHLPGKRKIALLGNMNELGKKSPGYHRDLGKIAAEYADEIFFVGKEAKSFLQGVQKKRPVTVFPSAQEAGKALKKVLQKGDFVLIKGSQNGVFLERAVRQLLLHSKDQVLLCRQGEYWKSKI